MRALRVHRRCSRKKLIGQPELRAAFRLAALLRCTVAELGQRMSASEFGLWLAFNAVEPILPGTELHLWARQMAAVHNGPMLKRDKTPWKAADFVGELWASPPPEDASAPTKSTATQLRGMIQHLRGAPKTRKPRL